MSYSTPLAALTATLLLCELPEGLKAGQAAAVPRPLRDYLADAIEGLLGEAERFAAAPTSPASACDFEQQVEARLREVGRLLVQHTYNGLEPAAAAPKHVAFEGTGYTRLNRKTPQHAWTLFGQVRLLRVGYRPTDKSGEPALFPLARRVGLIEGASPALAGRAAALLASAGMTQSLARQHLRRSHGVGWGVKKLRRFLAAMAERMAEQRHAAQVERLLGLLAEASASRGRHKPALGVGRDGITLGVRLKKGSLFEVATAATVTVYDRRAKRLGTVYLAYAPQPEQARMSCELTRLLAAVLRGWAGPLPRLCYVTDAGRSETGYYRRVLAPMEHPRTKERLAWVRVVDYYHASQRLWAMAECLFGKGPRAAAWARKMQRWLLKPGGVNRVLHSAAAYQSRSPLRGKGKEAYDRAYNYLRRRTRYLRYDEYRRHGLPIGSGVTEAACKTVFTQRLKLSGMRWEKEGAQRVLDLRVVLLSGVWEQALRRVLESMPVVKEPTQEPPPPDEAENAA